MSDQKPIPQHHGTPGVTSRQTVTWQELPRVLQVALERTPRGQWYRIRPMMVQSPEARRILDLAILVDHVIPRSTMGVRRKMASKEERLQKAQEMIENLDAYWAAVENLQTVLERIADSAGIQIMSGRPADRAKPKQGGKPSAKAEEAA